MLAARLTLVALAFTPLLPRDAAAQSSTAKGFALDTFDPAERNSDFFILDTLNFTGDLRPYAGATLDWGYKPLVSYNLNGTERSAIVEDQAFLHVGGGLVIQNHFRVGLNIPIAIYQNGTTDLVNTTTYKAASSAALGDPRLSADYLFFGEDHSPAKLAAGLNLYLPFGNTSQYAGDGQLRVAPHALFSGEMGMFVYSGKASVTILPNPETTGSVHLGSTVGLSAAGGVKLLADKLIIGPELDGSTQLAGDGDFFGKSTSPFEIVIGAHYRLGDFMFGLGAGPGIGDSYGTPTARFLGSFDWSPQPPPPPPPDRDHDGIIDSLDACPDTPGVATSNPKTNGCPPPPPPSDRDHDGIPDMLDACPDKAGPKTDDPKTNGCPPDRDHDGIPDAEDACPDKQGVRTNDPKTNGCPPDRDHDGIPDIVDACPDEPGVPSPDLTLNGCPLPKDTDGDGILDKDDACPTVPGIPELKGCPDKDTDGDGVPDRLDNCPTEKGPASNQGCPVAKKQLVVITKEKLAIKDKVYFDTNKSTIQKQSFKLLDQIASVLGSHAEIDKVTIEGHTDNVGDADHNRQLSQDRAASVKAYLVQKGVDPARLDAVGYGPDRAIDTNKSSKGRANNRRVDFTIGGPSTWPPPGYVPPDAPKPKAAKAAKKKGK